MEKGENAFVGIGFISAKSIEDFTIENQTTNNEDFEYLSLFDQLDSILFSSSGILKHGFKNIDLDLQALSYGETLGKQYIKGMIFDSLTITKVKLNYT